MTPQRYLALTLLLFAFAVPAPAFANDKPDDKPDEKQEDKEEKNDEDKKNDKKKSDVPKTVADIVAQCDHMPGLFDLYRHRKTGAVYMLIRPDQIGKEFIHFTYTENGIPRVGHFRGNFRGSRVFTIEREYKRVRFVIQPTGYHFDPDSALARAADANVSRAVIAAPEIIDEGGEKDGDLNGRLAVYLDGMFLKELWHQVRPTDKKNSDNTFKLGGLSAERTRYNRIRNYPSNTDIVVDYGYADIDPKAHAEREDGVVDSRYVTITLQHSLIEMPDNGYKPRFDDERVGYFMTQIDDMTSTSATPWRDVIHRWHLVKKKPKAKLSEPVEPIVWWIENTTPVEWRDTIRDAALTWNVAFEAAGFKNAVQVKVQPDDADWDAGDIRYNVLRWTSSPDPPFGGYGPSFVNPRTGQILGSDIMLEWIFVTNRVELKDLYTDAALNAADDAHASGDHRFCTAGHFAHHNTMVGLAALRAFNAPKVAEHQLLKESLYYLVLHEIGHTLGLNHNMASSQLHDPKTAHDATLTRKVGLTGSVMDYPSVNLAPPKERQGQYFTDRPGPYDIWAIRFGYDPALDDAEAREKHLSRSGEPELIFGNDADDMRNSKRGIDPRVMIGDMTGDAVQWAEGRFRLVDSVVAELLPKYRAKKMSLHATRDAYFSLMWHRRWLGAVVSRYVGGVYVDRSADARNGKGKPYRPVPADEQRRAMKVLAKHVFAPDALDAPVELLQHLRAQRRGFEFYDDPEAPNLHDAALRVHTTALDHLLHPTTLERITDTRLYGNTYGVAEMLGDLTDAVFKGDKSTNTVRQNLQIAYVKRLIKVANTDGGGSDYDYVAQSAALYQLRKLQIPYSIASGAGVFELLGKKGADESTAHAMHIAFLIDRALSDDKD